MRDCKMAAQLPGVPEPPTAWWPHDWLSFREYVAIYERFMDMHLNTGTVTSHGLVFTEVLGDPLKNGRRPLIGVRICGEVLCRNGVAINVERRLEARRRSHRGYEVIGRCYVYHARRTVDGVERSLFRYDNCPEVADLHLHEYHARTGEEVGRRSVSPKPSVRISAKATSRSSTESCARKTRFLLPSPRKLRTS